MRLLPFLDTRPTQGGGPRSRLSPRRARRPMLGAAAVELGLTMVPLLALTFGVTEYGRAIYTYNAIDKAARDAARYMTAPPPNAVDPAADAARLVVYGNVEGTGAALAPGLTTGMSACAWPATRPMPRCRPAAAWSIS